MKLFSSKRRVVTAAAVILLALFLVRPGVSRLKARITNSISRAVARPADIGSVHLRFLPRPGFELENLVIYEDPTFGAEPMLRAPEVTALVRLTSLLRGRLDISRLELTEPSLNLVRRADGQWNLEALLERTAHMPLAPTAKSKSEARPGFPYIEASSGRVNFKIGQEKKPYALLNADFALWQESENTWGVRLRAEPLRTDMSMSDTGLLRVDGTWQRAGTLRETPLQFNLEWNHAQLGQLTKLVSGNDKGWRGDVRLEATLAGIPAAMQITADTSIQDFHRYDIPSTDTLRLAAHCDGKYGSAERLVQEILCSAPVGDGMITLHGDAGLPGMHRINLSLNVEGVPVGALAQAARRAKKDLPADLVSTGSVQGNFTVKEDGPNPLGPQFQGRGEITNLRLQSTRTRVEFAPGSVPFVLRSGRADPHAFLAPKSAQKSDKELQVPDEPRIEYGPFPVALGRAAPAQARGWMSAEGFGMVIRGSGEVEHTLRLASLLGLPALKANAEGTAQLDLQIAGPWAAKAAANSSAFSVPEVTGTVQLHNVRALVHGVNGPVEIISAELDLLPDQLRVEQLSGRAGDANWTGSVTMPRGCGTPGACLIRFNLNTEEIGLSALSQWLGSKPGRRRWYQILTSAEPASPTFFEILRASGKVSAGHLRIHNIVANRVSASLELEGGKLKISELRGDVLGGKHRGDWQINFAAGSSTFAGSGTLTGISLKQVADAMHDPWISGTAVGTYQLNASGTNSAAFWQSAEGSLQFDLRDGDLPHVSLTGDEDPLHFVRSRGLALLRDGKIEIDQGKLVSPTETYEVGGNASFGRVLDIKLTRGTDVKSSTGPIVYSVTGTVAEPRIAISPAPETQAQLKP